MEVFTLEPEVLTDSICANCGAKIAANAGFCSFCGTAVTPQPEAPKPVQVAPVQNPAPLKKIALKGSWKRIVAIACCALTLLWLVLGIMQLTNKDLKYYKETLAECEASRADCVRDRDTAGYYWRSFYDDLIDTWDDLIAYWKGKIAPYHTRATVYFVLAGCCAAAAVALFVLDRKGRRVSGNPYGFHPYAAVPQAAVPQAPFAPAPVTAQPAAPPQAVPPQEAPEQGTVL